MDTNDIDWDERWRTGETPWDLGGPTPALVELLASGWLQDLGVPARGELLVPGAGAAWDVELFAADGWRVTAVDLSPEIARRAGARLRERGIDGEFLCADVLTGLGDREGQYDLLFDYTFFCAIPRERRGEYAATAARLLRPGGFLLHLVYPRNPDRAADQGPPFRTLDGDVDAAFGPVLERVGERQPVASFEHRQGFERWHLWRRPAEERR